MQKGNNKRRLAIALILAAATGAALLFAISASTHAAPVHTVPVKIAGVTKVLASAGSTGVSQSITTPHSFLSSGPCRRCLSAHYYSAQVLGLAPLAS